MGVKRGWWGGESGGECALRRMRRGWLAAIVAAGFSRELGNTVRRVRWVAAVCFAVSVLTGGETAVWAASVRDLSWHLDFLKIPQAHELSQGERIVVGVIDSGVDASHPDLAGQVLAGYGIGLGAAADGRTDSDPQGHGTGIAGLIATKGGDEQHAMGIAPKAKILPISLGTNSGSKELAEGIRWAVDPGAKVVNISLGGGNLRASQSEKEAITYALNKDIVVVAAAGNVRQGDQGVIAPGNVPGVVAVAGITQDGLAWSGSVGGPDVSIAAPSCDIVLTDPISSSPSGFSISQGTSASAAIVSGVVALVRSKFPQLSASNVINRIIPAAKKVLPGRDDRYGFDVIQPLAALTADVPEIQHNPLLKAHDAAGEKTEDPVAAVKADGVPVFIQHVFKGLLIFVILLKVGGAFLFAVILLRSPRKKVLTP